MALTLLSLAIGLAFGAVAGWSLAGDAARLATKAWKVAIDDLAAERSMVAFVSVCSSCGKYLGSHEGKATGVTAKLVEGRAVTSHSVCPDCARLLRGAA